MTAHHSKDAVRRPEDAPESVPPDPQIPAPPPSHDPLSWLLPLVFLVVTAAWIFVLGLAARWLIYAVF